MKSNPARVFNYFVLPKLKYFLDNIFLMAETTTAIEKPSDLKAPGIDGIANFWFKHLTALHEDLTNAYIICIENPWPEECPNWLTNGITYPPPPLKNYVPINNPLTSKPLEFFCSFEQLF